MTGGVPLTVAHPCLHGAVRHCQIQNNLVIRSKNSVAIRFYVKSQNPFKML